MFSRILKVDPNANFRIGVSVVPRTSCIFRGKFGLVLQVIIFSGFIKRKESCEEHDASASHVVSIKLAYQKSLV